MLLRDIYKTKQDLHENEELLKEQARNNPDDKEALKMLADLQSQLTPQNLGSHPTTPLPTFPDFETFPIFKEHTAADRPGKDVLHPLLPYHAASFCHPLICTVRVLYNPVDL